MGGGQQAGLSSVGRVRREPALKAYHLVPSVRGDLLHKLGRHEEARAAFEAAAALAGNRREQDLLRRRPAEAADATAISCSARFLSPGACAKPHKKTSHLKHPWALRADTR